WCAHGDRDASCPVGVSRGDARDAGVIRAGAAHAHRDSGWSAHVIVRSGTEPAVSGRSASRQPEIANPGIRGTLALNIRLPRPVRIAGVLVVATFLFDASAFGQQPDRARLDAPVATARRATGIIRIDGSLEEPDWASASPIGQLTQREPQEGQVASEATDVRVLFDEQALYLGIVCHESHARGVIATQLIRDANLDVDDRLTIVLDPFFDHRNGFFFQVNPDGARTDGQISNNAQDLNRDWDGIWDAAVVRTPDGWTAE